jgi:GT2 family glycosyltransferase
METPTNTVVGFVFTNYNSSEDTRNAIQSINSTMEKSIYQIVVVDNNSNEESVQALKLLEEDFSNIHLILSRENVGYFKGLNLGIKYIRDNFKEISYLVIGNNDLVFPANFYSAILKNSEILRTYAVISPNIVTREGIHQNPQVIKKISTLREIVYDLYYLNYYFAIIIKKIAEFTHKLTDRQDEKAFRIPQEIYQGHGSCYILGPVFFENFEQLDAPTFLMGEEFFLSLQLQRKNLSVYYVPDITVLHECHSSIAKVPNKKMWNISKKSHKEYRKYIKWI